MYVEGAGVAEVAATQPWPRAAPQGHLQSVPTSPPLPVTLPKGIL